MCIYKFERIFELVSSLVDDSSACFVFEIAKKIFEEENNDLNESAIEMRANELISQYKESEGKIRCTYTINKHEATEEEIKQSITDLTKLDFYLDDQQISIIRGHLSDDRLIDIKVYLLQYKDDFQSFYDVGTRLDFIIKDSKVRSEIIDYCKKKYKYVFIAPLFTFAGNGFQDNLLLVSQVDHNNAYNLMVNYFDDYYLIHNTASIAKHLLQSAIHLYALALEIKIKDVLLKNFTVSGKWHFAKDKNKDESKNEDLIGQIIREIKKELNKNGKGSNSCKCCELCDITDEKIEEILKNDLRYSDSIIDLLKYFAENDIFFSTRYSYESIGVDSKCFIDFPLEGLERTANYLSQILLGKDLERIKFDSKDDFLKGEKHELINSNIM